jgi:hypothetical protein
VVSFGQVDRKTTRGKPVIDPVTLYLAKKGVEKLGPYARDWIKGDTTRQLVASLAATVEPEEQFELINFASLEADAKTAAPLTSRRDKAHFSQSWQNPTLKSEFCSYFGFGTPAAVRLADARPESTRYRCRPHGDSCSRSLR